MSCARVGRPDASAPEVQRFADAAAALHQRRATKSRSFPSRICFSATPVRTWSSRADRPPTTVEARFRTEVTSLAEHLRRLVARRERRDDSGRSRARQRTIFVPRFGCCAGRSRVSATQTPRASSRAPRRSRTSSIRCCCRRSTRPARSWRRRRCRLSASRREAQELGRGNTRRPRDRRGPRSARSAAAYPRRDAAAVDAALEPNA